MKRTQARPLLDVKSASLHDVLRTIREKDSEASVILGLRHPREVVRVRADLPQATIIALPRDMSDAAAFADAGADAIRLWSDWVENDPGLVGRTRALGPQVWVMIGRSLPNKKRDWRELHGRMIAAGAQGLISNRPDLISNP